MKRNKKFNEPKAKRKLDRLFSAYILNRDSRQCQRCGATNCKIDCCHLIPREVLITRWHKGNAIGMCVKCHKYGKESWHKSPLEAVKWMENNLGVVFIDALIKQSHMPYTFNEAEYNRILKEFQTQVMWHKENRIIDGKKCSILTCG